MDNHEYERNDDRDPREGDPSLTPVEFIKIQPRHIPLIDGQEDDDQASRPVVRHYVRPPRRFNLFRLVVWLAIIIMAIVAMILVSRCVIRNLDAAKETTQVTTILVTTEAAAEPNRILTIQEGKRYNIRSSPDQTSQPLKSATGGDSYMITGTVTGEKTDFGDQWFEIDLDGQKAYIIVDGEGQDVTESKS